MADNKETRDAFAGKTGDGSTDPENIRERVLDVIAHYKRTKSAIRKEVRKDFLREIKNFEEERGRREKVIKEKMIEIEHLEAKIESLDNAMYGLKSRSKLWEHECARISEAYYRTIAYYSNPGLIEVQLQVILEYTDALARFVGSHKWEKETLDTARTFCESIHSKMEDILHGIDANIMDDISIASARSNIETASQE